jgi:pimeloyl-ACP methyl ester carboxylesterase
VRAAHWLSHIEYDPKSLVRSPWLRELSQQNTYIRYDQRGWGPSDLSAPNMSFESWISDLEAVVDAQRLERFALLGMSQGGAIAIAFATRHPERVSQLVFFGAYGLGMLRRKGSPSSGMKRGPARAGPIRAADARVGAALSLVLLGETFTSAQAAGAALVLAGIMNVEHRANGQSSSDNPGESNRRAS